LKTSTGQTAIDLIDKKRQDIVNTVEEFLRRKSASKIGIIEKEDAKKRSVSSILSDQDTQIDPKEVDKIGQTDKILVGVEPSVSVHTTKRHCKVLSHLDLSEESENNDVSPHL